MSQSLILLLVAVSNLYAGQGDDTYPYVAATSGTAEDSLLLTPFHGNPVRLPIRPSNVYEFDTGGKFLYAQLPEKSGYFKFDLSTGLDAKLPGTDAFPWSPSPNFRVSEQNDLLAIFGDKIERDGGCALYLISLSTGLRRTFFEETPCRTFLGNLDFPMGRKVIFAVASKDRGPLHPVLIDIATGSMKPMNHSGVGEYVHYQWSPNGNYVAAEEIVHDGFRKMPKLVLLDPIDLKRVRSLTGLSDLRFAWSPDSRFVLISRPSFFCGGYAWSFHVVNVRNGKEKAIKSSRCQVLGGSDGWVSPEVYQRALAVQTGRSSERH